MKLLLSTSIILGGVLLTQNSFAWSGSETGKGSVVILPCGKAITKQGLQDGSCKKDALKGKTTTPSTVSTK